MRIRHRILVGATLLAGAALVAAAVALPSSASRAGPKVSLDDDALTDYGVCRGVDTACYNEWQTVFRTDGVKQVLVYSATGVSRHAHLGPKLAAGMNPPLAESNVAQNAVVRWGAENDFKVDWTEDVTELDSAGKLLKYDAVIFLSNSRDILDDAAQTSLMQYIRAGGGFVGIHNTLGAEYNWPYFQGLLGGANFYDHGPSRDGVVAIANQNDVSTATLPARFDFKDEFYNLAPFPSNVRVLARVDTDTLTGGGKGFNGHPGHAGNHPVSWCQYYDGGRSWVTSLGHEASQWREGSDPHSQNFKTHLVNGILSAMGEQPFCQK